MSLQRLLWMLVAVAVITANSIAANRDSAAADAPSAAALAAFFGCSAAKPRPYSGARETVACKEDGFDVTVMTFNDNTQRDAWVNSEKLVVASAGFMGVSAALISGDRWAVATGDVPTAERLHAVAGGWRV
ncbi:hypothetical protein AB0M46_16365 [Dactylosporangium sp. NPDC051485]|uniref:hypothetical protein n=1 Tax=Dactylosporangium sp. NPDC051485 TaxID=3154846 RepID=UPI003414EC31